MDGKWNSAGQWTMIVAGLLVLVLTMPIAVAADNQSESDPASEVLARRGSITLRDMKLPDALFTISETWQVNLLFGQEVTGDVNGAFRNVTLREVLDSLLLANGYGYRPKGQSLIIMKLEELGDTNAMLRTDVLPLRRQQSADIVEAARMFLSPQGKLQTIPSMSSVMVRDYPENIERVRQFVGSVGEFDQQQSGGRLDPAVERPPGELPGLPIPIAENRTSVVYFSPRHTQAESLRESFETFLGGDAQVVVVAEENRIAVVAPPDGIQLARQIFHELDQPRSQVRITALIYDVNVEELERLGVNWTHNAKASLNSAGAPRHSFGGKFGPMVDPASGAFGVGGAVADAAADSASSAATLGAAQVMTLNKYFDLDAIISALDQTDGARLLADPTVTVLDREQATIRIVTEVPIQQLTQTPQGGDIGTTSFRDAGVTLEVSPQVGDDGTITMQVSPTFSVLSGFSEGQPIINTRETTTKVRIADRQTIVIGGLRQRSEVETIAGIPKLMSWKRVGKLFRSHSTTVRESELMVFLRPQIVTVDEVGTERHLAGLCTAHQALARLNWPNELPVIPSCNDPNCPYHNPRPRFSRARVRPAAATGHSIHSGQHSATSPFGPPQPIAPDGDDGPGGNSNGSPPTPIPDPFFVPQPLDPVPQDAPAGDADQSALKAGAPRTDGSVRSADRSVNHAAVRLGTPRFDAQPISHVKVTVPPPETAVAANKKSSGSLWPKWMRGLRIPFTSKK